MDASLPNSAAWRDAATLCIDDTIYAVAVDRPDVEEIRVLSRALPGAPLTAAPAFLRGCVEDEIAFEWFAGEPEGVRKGRLLATGVTYTPQSQEEGQSLTLLCSPPGGGVPARASVGIIAGAPAFDEITHARQRASNFSGETPPLHGAIRFLSYNLLSSAYVGEFSSLYPYATQWALDTERRVQLAMDEVIRWRPSVACLQEVDDELFANAWMPTMRANGFDGAFCPKGEGSIEGSAMFWDSQRFERVASREVSLAEAARRAVAVAASQTGAVAPRGECGSAAAGDGIGEYLHRMQRECDSAVLSTLLRVAQTVQLCVLQEREMPERRILVLNTHLYYKKWALRERTIQAGLMLGLGRDFRRELAELHDWNEEPPMVVCGDLNAEPQDLPIRYLLEGVEETDSEWRIDSSGDEAPAGQGATLSAAPALECATGVPSWTNRVDKFEGTLDWVLVERGRLVPMRHAPPVADSVGSLPSEEFPSDHIAVCCDVQYTP